MQVAVELLNALFRLALVAVAIATGGSVHGARAQEAPAEAPAGGPTAEAPPVAIGGWRYEKSANDVHLFHCQNPACVPGSRVSYRFYPAGTVMTFVQYRSEQEMVVKALQQRAPPGTSIKIIAIEGDEVATLPRMYKSRRLTVAPDGSQEHVHSGLLMGEKASASLISSSRDDKAATAGFTQYALGLMLSIHASPPAPLDLKK